jgi:F-type H+-transporting ATPase subunit epsilon
MSFQLSIITPQGKAFEGKVDSVAAAGLEGGFEVLSGHAAIVAALKEGKTKIRLEGREQVLSTASGVLEVAPDHNVTILVDSAV